jgi:formylglycine-generating enzyme required for sulfatase activity
MRLFVAAALAAALLLSPVSARLAAPEDSRAAAALYREGAGLLEAGRYEQARDKLQQAVRLSAGDPARVLLGRALVELGDCTEALPVLRAIRLDRLERGERERFASDLDSAFSDCGSSLAKEEEAQRLVSRARERLAVKQFAGARKDAERAREIAPGDRVLLWLAYTYEVTGNCDKALRLYRSIDPSRLPADEEAEARQRIAAGVEACSRPPQDMVHVPGGTFEMGSTRGEPDEAPIHTVTLAPYYLDRTEVTIGRFAACVEAGGCRRETFLAHSDKPYCNFGNAQRDQFPMNCVSWEGARDFCRWAGKRLPTEAEWESAARTPDGRTYPWGEEPPTCSLAVMKSEANDGCGEDRTWAVASRPRGVSETGVFDLAGNVWEWVQDWYSATYYASSPTTNPPGPATGELRVMRGGSWLSDAAGRSLRSTNRDNEAPSYQGNAVGFRCARDASPTD